MGDFLADIAERSLTTTQTIRPRPLSVFEPLEAMGAVGLVQQPEAALDELLPVGAMETVGMTPITMTGREDPPVRGEADAVAVQAPGVSIRATIADQEPVASSAIRSAATPAPLLLVPAPLEQPAGQGENRPAAIRALLDTVPSFGPRAPFAEATFPASDMDRKPRAGSPAVAVKGVDATGQKPVVPALSKLNGTVVEPTPIKPAVQRVEVANSGAGLPQQPIAPLLPHMAISPTIHVTIGRIEVRATPASVQNPSKPRPPEAMSLDEYLRSRNGGGR